MAPYQYPIAPLPPDRASLGVDAVIDFSRSVIVSDFRLVRQSNILAVIHKASEGGDYADTACAARRPQAEAFVQAVAQATGRLPVVYVHPTWANGDPLLGSGLSLGARITPDSILARCGLWVADYHDSPEIPLAWEAIGWRLWQYAGDESAGRPPTARPASCAASATAIATCSTAKRRRSIGSGAQSTELLRYPKADKGQGDPGSPGRRGGP